MSDKKIHQEYCDSLDVNPEGIIKPCNCKSYPTPYRYDLWKHMHDEHGLILLESEIESIVQLVIKTEGLVKAQTNGQTNEQRPCV